MCTSHPFDSVPYVSVHIIKKVVRLNNAVIRRRHENQLLIFVKW